MRTVGVEEEFMLVAPEWTPRSAAAATALHPASLEPGPSAGAQPPGGGQIVHHAIERTLT
ncbi:MAG TPA: hypothetical protein VIK12_02115 [Pengzhenrongella sp.]